MKKQNKLKKLLQEKLEKVDNDLAEALEELKALDKEGISSTYLQDVIGEALFYTSVAKDLAKTL